MTIAEIMASKEPVLVDVFTASCGPCRGMMPVIQEMKREGHNVVAVDAWEEPDFCLQHAVESVPTFLVIANGVVTKRLQGTQTKAVLLSALKGE